MSKMIKKCRSWLLAASLAFVGAGAWADPVAKVGAAEYETVAAAFAAAKDGEVVTLLADANTQFETKRESDASPAPDIEGKSLTLDLNGFRLGANKAYCYLGDNAGLTIKDSSAAKTGALVPASGAYAPWLVPAAYGGIHVYGKNVTVSLESGTYTYSVGDTDANMGALIGFNAGDIGASDEANARISISGGTFVSDAAGSHKNCVVTTYGKKVDVTVTGGTFLPTGKDTTAYFNVRGGESSLKISGGDFQGKNPLQQSTLQSTSKVEVSGGTFANEIQDAQLAFGAGKTYDETTGRWTVTPPPPVVAIDGTPFEGRLAEAFKAAKDGAVLTLLADANTVFETMKENDVSPAPYYAGKSLTLDLNGFRLGVSKSYGRPCYFLLGDGAGLTIKDSSAAQTGALVKTTGARALYLVPAAGGGILVYGKNVTVNLEGGSYVYSHADTDSNMSPLIGVDLYDGNSTTTEMNAKVNISGGTFVSDEKGSHNNCVVVTYGRKFDINVSGGTFSTGLDARAYFHIRGAESTLKISGGEFQGKSPVLEGALADTSKAEVSGGTFGVDPSAHVVAGYKAADNGDGTWTVVERQVAKVGKKVFKSFEDATEYAKANGGEVLILDREEPLPDGLARDWKKSDDGSRLVRRVLVAEIGETVYEDLAEAFLAVKAGDTLKILADVDLAGKAWPYVRWWFNESQVPVTVDGQGHTIRNLKCDDMGNGYVGLIAVSSGGLVVKNLTVADSVIRGQRGAVLGGDIYQGTFTNVVISGAAIEGQQKCGGLVGMADSGHYLTVVDCEVRNVAFTGIATSEGGVESGDSFGGLVGFVNRANNVLISGCRTSGISFSNVTKAEYYLPPREKLYYQYVSHPFVAALMGVGETGQAVNLHTITLANNAVEQVAGIPKAPMGNDYLGFYYTEDCASRPLSKIVIDGKDVQNWAAAKIGGTKYMMLEDAVKAVRDGETIVILHDNAESFTAAPGEGVTTFTMDNSAKYSLSGEVTAPDGFKFAVDEAAGICTYKARAYAVQVGDDRYETIAEAVSDAPDGAVVTLLADVNTVFDTKAEADASPAPNFSDKSLTLDLNGFRLGANKAYFLLGEGAGLTVRDSSEAQSGAFVKVSGKYAPWLAPAAYGGICIYGTNVTVSLEGGTYAYSVGDTDANMGALVGMSAYSIREAEEANARISISGGTFVSDEKGSHNSCVVTTWGKGVDVSVSGGTFSTGKDATAYFNVRGGGSTLKISGGDFRGASPILQGALAGGSAVEVSGGTFGVEPSADDVVAGCRAVEGEGGRWTVRRGVAAVDGELFMTFEAAISRSRELGGSEIVVLDDKAAVPADWRKKDGVLVGRTYVATLVAADGTETPCELPLSLHEDLLLADGDTVRLTNDVTLAEGDAAEFAPPADATVAFDLNGRTLTGVVALGAGAAGTLVVRDDSAEGKVIGDLAATAGAGVIRVESGTYEGGLSQGGGSRLVLTGGQYGSDPTGYVPEGYRPVRKGDDWLVGVHVRTDDRPASEQGHEAATVINRQTTSVDGGAVDEVVGEAKMTVGEGAAAREVSVADAMKKSTQVEGVRLTLDETVEVVDGKSGEVAKVSGVQAVVRLAREQAARLAESSGDEGERADAIAYTNALETADLVEVTVNVAAAPTGYAKTEDGTVATFALSPDAEVVVSDGGRNLSQVVTASNDMIDQGLPIYARIVTGTRPAMIVHTADASEGGGVIETFRGDEIEFDPDTGVSRVRIRHFSDLTSVPVEPKVMVGTRPFGSLDAALAFLQNECYLYSQEPLQTVSVLTNLDETLSSPYKIYDYNLAFAAEKDVTVKLSGGAIETALYEPGAGVDGSIAFGSEITWEASGVPVTSPGEIAFWGRGQFGEVKGQDISVDALASVECSSYVAVGGSSLHLGQDTLVKAGKFNAGKIANGRIDIVLSPASGYDVAVIDCTGEPMQFGKSTNLVNNGALVTDGLYDPRSYTNRYWTEVVDGDLWVRRTEATVGAAEYNTFAGAYAAATNAGGSATVRLVAPDVALACLPAAGVTVEGLVFADGGGAATEVAGVGGRLLGTVRNCVFASGLEGCDFAGGAVENCVFRGALAGCSFGDVTFRNCRFEGADGIVGAVCAGGARFENCVFATAGRGVCFASGEGEVVFAGCTVAGVNEFAEKVAVVFDGGRFDGVEGNPGAVCRTYGSMTLTNVVISTDWIARSGSFIGNAATNALTEVYGTEAEGTNVVAVVGGADNLGIVAFDPVMDGGYTNGTFRGVERDVAAALNVYRKPVPNGDGISYRLEDKDDDWIDWAPYGYAAGVDEEKRVVTIQSADDLAFFAKQLYTNGVDYAGYTVRLESDLDLSGHVWVPTGAFRGVFDGQGHAVSGLTATGTAAHAVGACAGLFGEADGATVRNLALRGATVRGGVAGSLVGSGRNVTVLNCTATNVAVAATDAAGGLAGALEFAGAETVYVSTNAVYGTASAASGAAGGLAGRIAGANGLYDVRRNYVDVGLAGTAKSPFGALADGQAADFATNLAANVTANWWTDLTSGDDVYAYAVAGAADQLVYRGLAGAVAAGGGSRRGYWGGDALAKAVAAVQEGGTVVLYADNAEDIAAPPALSFTFDANGHRPAGSFEPAHGYKFVAKGGGVCEYKPVADPLKVDYAWSGTNAGAVVEGEYVYGYDAFSSLNDVAQWLWNGRSVLVQGEAPGGSSLAADGITLTDGAYGVTGASSGFVVNGLTADGASLHVTNADFAAWKFVATGAGGAATLADSRIEFVREAAADGISYLCADNGAALTVSNLTQAGEGDFGRVRLEARNGADARVHGSDLRVWNGSGVTGGATLSLFGGSLSAPDFTVSGEGSALLVAGADVAVAGFANGGTVGVTGESRLSAEAFTGGINLGKAGEETVLTTDGLKLSGNILVADGSTVTLTGNGFEFANMFQDSLDAYNIAPTNHIGYTLNVLNADLFKTYGFYINTNSVVNVKNVQDMKMDWINVYGGTLNVTGMGSDQRAKVSDTVLLTGVMNVSNVLANVTYLNVFAGIAGRQGGALTVDDATVTVDGLYIGNKTESAKKYAIGTDQTATATFTNSKLYIHNDGDNVQEIVVGGESTDGTLTLAKTTIGASDANSSTATAMAIGAKGKVELTDLTSQIKATAFTNAGLVTVDASGAEAVSEETIGHAVAYTNVVATGDTADFGACVLTNNADYMLVVTNKCLVTVRKAAWVISADGKTTNRCDTLSEAFAKTTDGCTVSVLRDVCEDAAVTSAATAFTFRSNGHALSGTVEPAAGYKFVRNGDGTCSYAHVDDPLAVNDEWKGMTAGERVAGTDYVYGYDAFSSLGSVARWLWNGRSVLVQGAGGGDPGNTVTLTNGTFALTTGGTASGFGIDGLLVGDGALSFTNVLGKASRIGALANGVAEVRDSTVTFAGADNRIYAEDGGRLTVSNLTQTAADGDDWGDVRLEAKSGARVNVYDSVLHVGDGSGVTGGATMTLAGSDVHASVFAVSGAGSALDVWGTNRLSAAALTGGFNVGRAGEETVLETDGLSVTGTVRVADGSVVTLVGDGFDFSTDSANSSMFQDSAEKYNANGHVGYTLNVKDANLFQTYGFYANTGSVVNVENVADLRTWYFNVYGGTMNVTGTDKTAFGASATENFNVTGAMNVRKVAAHAATLKVYAGGEGQQGGAFTATDAEVKARFVSLGSEATEAKKYAPGTPAATMALTNSTLIVNNVDGDNPNTFVIGTNNTVATLILKGSTVDYNHSTTPYASNADMIVGANGKVEMDVASSIAASTFANAGKVTVDGSGAALTDDNLKAVPESYTLVACAATMTETNDFGDVTLEGNDDYYLAVASNSLVATRKAAWVISADGSKKTSYVDLKDAFANVKSNETISVLHANDEDIGTIPPSEFTFRSNGYAMRKDGVTAAAGHTFFYDEGTGECRYGRIVATVGDRAYVTLHEALVAAKPAGSVCKLAIDYDVSLETDNWEPFGDGSEANLFNGTFDGQGHKLTGLNINRDKSYVALIGDLGRHGTVKDLTIVSPSIYAGSTADYAGVVVGRQSGVVTNVTVTGGSLAGGEQVGGIAGYIFNGKILGCTVDGTAISGKERVGGLVGKQQVNNLIDIVGNTVRNANVTAAGYSKDSCGAAGLVSQIMTAQEASRDSWRIADNRITNVTTVTGGAANFAPIGNFRTGEFRFYATNNIVRNNWQPIVDIEKDYQVMVNPADTTQSITIPNYWVVEAFADGALTNKYLSVEDAAAGAGAGWRLELLEDADLSAYAYQDYREIVFATNVTFDLKGFEIRAKSGGFTFGGEGLTVTNGTFSCVCGEPLTYALDIGGGDWTDVTLVDLECKGGVSVSGASKVTLRDMTVVDSDLQANPYYAVWGEGGARITVESGTYRSSSTESACAISSDSSSSVTILDGTFELAGDFPEWNSILMGGAVAKGGVYNYEPPADKVDPEYVAKPQGTDPETWKVAVGVAKVGDVLYHTLADAVAEAEGGDTVTLTRSSSGDGIVVDKSLTIDFATNTYTVVTNYAGSAGTQNQAFQLLSGNTVVFSNGTIVADGPGLKKIIQNYANLTLVGMTLDATAGATNIVKYVLSNNCGETTIGEGTTIVAKDGGVAFDVYYWPPRYGDGLSVTVAPGAKIVGAYEYGHDETVTDQDLFELKATLVDESLKLDPLTDYVWTAGRRLVKAYARNERTGELYATLADAVKEADPNDKITVLRSAEGDGIEIGKSLTVDFGGKTYTVATNAFVVTGDAAVTFTNGTVAAKAGSGAETLVRNCADLTLAGMTLDGTGLDGGEQGARTLAADGGKTVVDGSAVVSRGGAGDFALGVSCRPPHATNAVAVAGGSTVTGGVEVTSYGGGKVSLALESGEVTGGIVMGEGSGDATVVRKEGFLADPPEGYVWDKDGVLRRVVWTSGGEKYATLQEALDAVGAGPATVELAADATGPGAETAAGQDVVIDFAGRAYAVDATVGEGCALKLAAGSSVVLTNGTLGSSAASVLVLNGGGDLTAADVSLVGTNGAACACVVANAGGAFRCAGGASLWANDGAAALDAGGGAAVVVDTLGTVRGYVGYGVLGDPDGATVAVLRAGLVDNGTNGNWRVGAGHEEAAAANVSVSGGRFSAPVPKAYCAPWHVPVENGDGTYGVKGSRTIVDDVKASQRYPWNDWVDVTFTFRSLDDVRLVVQAFGRDGAPLGVRSVSPADAPETSYDLTKRGFDAAKTDEAGLESRRYHLIWRSNADGALSQGVRLEDVTFKVMAK